MQIEDSISVSIGEAVSPTDEEPLIGLFRIADRRMYENKKQVRFTKTGQEFGIPASILSLVFAIESRDAYTSGHSLRVAFFAWKLAEQMKIGPSIFKSAFRAGLVHDVGKIGVPDAILNKKGKLTDSEFDIIMQHPTTGFEMCKKLGFSKAELDVIRFHHEHWDGTGYPLGLSGAEIPLLTRVVSVVDVYDALTTSRPYRTAWTSEKTLNFLVEMKNVHFDPVCVDAWIDLNNTKLQLEAYDNWAKDAQLIYNLAELKAI